MKKNSMPHLKSLVLALSLLLGFITPQKANAQYVNIPDSNFKSWVLNNVPHSTSLTDITPAEAAAYNGAIVVSIFDIFDLTGIEAFINIDSLDCSNNELSSLDVSKNVKLVYLNCAANNNVVNGSPLTKLDVSKNINLKYLDCSDCYISSLDVSANPSLTYFDCRGNTGLNSLIIQNGYNKNLTTFLAQYNSDLTCIQVDDVSYSTANWSSFIDPTADFSTNCSQTPKLSSFSPSTAVQGDAITLTGHSFILENVISVNIGGVSAKSFKVLNDSVITAVVGNTISGEVTVANKFGRSSLPGFTYAASPLINSFSPDSAFSGTTITIVGKYFTAATNISFGGVSATSFTVENDSTITAVVGNGASGAVNVSNSFGQGTLSGFTYLSAPIVSTFYPKNAYSDSSITIKGSFFSGVTAITFGGISAKSFKVLNDSMMVATVGLGASGGIEITNAFGKTVAYWFTFLSHTYISISSFSPTSSNCKSSNNITIYGTGFNNTSSVTIGGATIGSYKVVSDSVITLFVDSTIPSGKITITTPLGVANSLDEYTAGTKEAYSYIINSRDNTVSVINTALNKVVTTIIVGKKPSGVCMSPDGSKVFVANSDDSTISVISTVFNNVEATINLVGVPFAMCISPDGTKLYVPIAGGSTLLSVINTSNNTVAETNPIYGFSRFGIVTGLDGIKLYTTTYSNGTVIVIDARNNTLIKEITVGRYPTYIASSPDGSKIYVVNSNSNTLSIINTQTDSVIGSISIGSYNFSYYYGGMCTSIDGTKIYISSYIYNQGNVIDIYDAKTGGFIRRIYVDYSSDDVGGLSESPDGKLLYAVDYRNNKVDVIDTKTYELLQKIDVGRSPASFGKFIGGVPKTCAELPLKLVDFYASSSNGITLLKWTTANEVNTDKFAIQRSNNGSDFYVVGTVLAKGTSNSHYSFVDGEPIAAPFVYYRLQMIDKDGSHTYSKVVKVSLPQSGSPISISPNPARNSTTLGFNSTIVKGTVSIYSTEGKKLLAKNIANTNAYLLNTQHLTNGLYMVEVNTGNNIYKAKMVVAK